MRCDLLQVRAYKYQNKNQNPYLFDSQVHTLPIPWVSKAMSPQAMLIADTHN